MNNSFSKNSIITFLTEILVFLLGLGTLIIISRVLGPQGKGVYSLIILLPGLALVFGSFGISSANVYYIGSKKYKSEEIVGTSIILSLFLGLFLIVFFWALFQFDFFQNFIKTNKIISFYLWIAIFSIPFSLIYQFLGGIIKGKQRIGDYNLIRIGGTVVQFFFVLVFVLILKRGVFGAILAYFLSLLSLAFFSLYFIKKISKISLSFNKKFLKDSFFYGLKVYLANSLSYLNYRLDMFLIAVFLNPMAIGFYSIAVAISEKLFMIPGAVSTVLFPKISASFKEEADRFSSRVSRHVFLILIILIILMIGLAKPLILFFFGKAFLPAARPLVILLPGILAFGISGILAADLGGRGKPHFALLASFFCLAINIPLNILLIPKWGIEGAAFASAISYWVDALIMIAAFSKISQNSLREILLIKKQDLEDYKRIYLAIRKKIKYGK